MLQFKSSNSLGAIIKQNDFKAISQHLNKNYNLDSQEDFHFHSHVGYLDTMIEVSSYECLKIYLRHMQGWTELPRAIKKCGLLKYTNNKQIMQLFIDVSDIELFNNYLAPMIIKRRIINRDFINLVINNKKFNPKILQEMVKSEEMVKSRSSKNTKKTRILKIATFLGLPILNQ